jgi:hypothetical protein
MESGVLHGSGLNLPECLEITYEGGAAKVRWCI